MFPAESVFEDIASMLPGCEVRVARSYDISAAIRADRPTRQHDGGNKTSGDTPGGQKSANEFQINGPTSANISSSSTQEPNIVQDEAVQSDGIDDSPELWALVGRLEAHIKSLQQECDGHADSLTDARRRIQNLRADLSSAHRRIRQLERSLEDARSINRSSSKPSESETSTRQSGGIKILTVEYGGRIYTPDKYPKTFAKLYEAALDKKPFTVGDSVFGDPWPGAGKSCSFTYLHDVDVTSRRLVGRELDRLRFD
jgi:hypothetical protein